MIASADGLSDPYRRCPGCGSLERQRVFADLYRARIRQEFDLAGQRLLLIAPKASELRFLKETGAAEVVTLEARPSENPDLVADICRMPQVPDRSFDAVFGSDVLSGVPDLDRALAEIARVLRPDGVLLISDPIAKGRETEEYTDVERITSAYGKEVYEKFRVGTFRRFGEIDIEALIGSHFTLEARTGVDAPTGAEVVWHLCRKAGDRRADPAPEERAAAADAFAVGTVADDVRPERSAALRVTSCPFCGDALMQLENKENCPKCGSRPRLRSFAAMLPEIIEPLAAGGNLRERELLAFAMTGPEQKILEPVYPSFKSVSLFGTYGQNHESGVDTRDLSRYPADNFAGYFGILLFDYFEEHEVALREAFRVIAPGGIFFTHIAPFRLTDDAAPPMTMRRIQPRKGYIEYVPKEIGLADVRVGRPWFVQAMRQAGFKTRWVQVEDTASGIFLDWFIGMKPGGGSTPSDANAAGEDADPATSSPAQVSGRPVPADGVRSLSVSGCPVCGTSSSSFDGSEDCPRCKSGARHRTLAPVIASIVKPLLSACFPLSRALLAFGMEDNEKKLLNEVFNRYKSVSLYGDYQEDHEVGVDARDLSRYKTDEFCGLFSIALFDFFLEHEQALKEAFRVIAAGGLLFTTIMPYRLVDGDQEPVLHYTIEPRPGHFAYLPAGSSLPSIKVGRQWFLDAISRAGFEARRTVVRDEASRQDFDWFIGVKPQPARSPADDVQPVQAAHADDEPRVTATPLAAPAILSSQTTPVLSRSFSTPVDPDFGFRLVSLTLTVPSIPSVAAGSGFACHAFRTNLMMPADNVYAVQKGGVLASNDLGEHWQFVPTPETGEVRLFNAFGMSDGSVLLQGIGPHGPDDPRGDPELEAPLFICDKDLKVIDRVQPGKINWHGPRSIDESHGTIIYAEYPENSSKYRSDFKSKKLDLLHLCDASSVFRSTDGGRSWAKVFEKSWEEIRHFHTAMADPYRRGVWYVSSGDAPHESRIWRSDDDGQSWHEVTADADELALHPSIKGRHGSIHRHTDMAILPDRLIWGTDDMLGHPNLFHDLKAKMSSRVGSRVFMSPKTAPLQPECIAFVGSHVRSMVDVGPAYLLMTEAKHVGAVPRPQVCLLSKAEPYLLTELFTVDRYHASRTGFTYSRASRAAKDGRFFSFRDSRDVFSGGPSILQWDIRFE